MPKHSKYDRGEISGVRWRVSPSRKVPAYGGEPTVKLTLTTDFTVAEVWLAKQGTETTVADYRLVSSCQGETSSKLFVYVTKLVPNLFKKEKQAACAAIRGEW